MIPQRAVVRKNTRAVCPNSSRTTCSIEKKKKLENFPISLSLSRIKVIKKFQRAAVKDSRKTSVSLPGNFNHKVSKISDPELARIKPPPPRAQRRPPRSKLVAVTVVVHFERGRRHRRARGWRSASAKLSYPAEAARRKLAGRDYIGALRFPSDGVGGGISLRAFFFRLLLLRELNRNKSAFE